MNLMLEYVLIILILFSMSRRAPKRAILKETEVNSLSVGTTQSSNTLGEVTTIGRTLVRIVGNLVYNNTGVGTGASVVFVIAKVDDGDSSLAVSFANDSEVYPKPAAVLYHGIIRANVASEGALMLYIPVDVKGMRKMKKGDKLDLIVDGSQAASGVLGSSLSLFYKEV